MEESGRFREFTNLIKRKNVYVSGHTRLLGISGKAMTCLLSVRPSVRFRSGALIHIENARGFAFSMFFCMGRCVGGKAEWNRLVFSTCIAETFSIYNIETSLKMWYDKIYVESKRLNGNDGIIEPFRSIRHQKSQLQEDQTE